MNRIVYYDHKLKDRPVVIIEVGESFTAVEEKRKRIYQMNILAIEDRGEYFHVYWDGVNNTGSSYENPFMVGKSEIV